MADDGQPVVRAEGHRAGFEFADDQEVDKARRNVSVVRLAIRSRTHLSVGRMPTLLVKTHRLQKKNLKLSSESITVPQALEVSA